MSKATRNFRNHAIRNKDSAAKTEAPHILLVEDESDYAIKLMQWLNGWRMPLFSGECRVDIAQNVKQATEFLEKDIIDIYIVDLVMKQSDDSLIESEEAGKSLVRKIVERTNAGIIVYSSLAATNEAAPLIKAGADDYIQKHSDQETMRARVLGLWRRIQFIRPKKRGAFVHTNRVFLIGNWRYRVGHRTLTNESGESVRLSATEHAFLRHICTVDGHECSVEEFNLEVLGRRNFERDLRVDNLIYRLRKKLGEEIQLVADTGVYRLVDIKELRRRPTAA